MAKTEPKQFYTVEEANHALPLVRAIVADIVRQFREIHERKDRLKHITSKRPQRREGDVYGDEVARIEEEIEKDIVVLQGYIEELNKLGVELKDPVKGLIDFRSIQDGREVYLCWHLGEDEVAYWHELDAGFAGRQSLLASSGSGIEPDADDGLSE
jgi:hypothetical protein